MKLLNSRKAAENPIASDAMFIIIFAIALAIAFIFTNSIIASFLSNDLQIPKDIEPFILMQRFWNSPSCFAYEDVKTGRVYQKVIDIEKFKTKDAMNKCFSNLKSRYAFKFELENPETNAKIETLTPNWVQGSNFKLEQKNVFVYSNNKIRNQKLSIFIQNA